MVTVKYLIILANAISPGASDQNNGFEVLSAIASVVNATPPPQGWTSEQFASVMVATAWRESRFNSQAVGDNGRSTCAFQVKGGSTTDPVQCASRAAHVIRESVRTCPSSPLAGYCGGCAVPAARKEGDLRISIAASAKARADQTLRMPAPTPKVPRRPPVKDLKGNAVRRFANELRTEDFAEQPTVAAPRELNYRSQVSHIESGGFLLLPPRALVQSQTKSRTDKSPQ